MPTELDLAAIQERAREAETAPFIAEQRSIRAELWREHGAALLSHITALTAELEEVNRENGRLRGSLGDLLGPLHIINTYASMAQRRHAEQHADIEGWSQEIMDRRTEMHLAILAALGTSPATTAPEHEDDELPHDWHDSESGKCCSFCGAPYADAWADDVCDVRNAIVDAFATTPRGRATDAKGMEMARSGGHRFGAARRQGRTARISRLRLTKPCVVARQARRQ